MNNNNLAIEIYKRLLEVGINASMKSVSIIEEVLNEERERNLTTLCPECEVFLHLTTAGDHVCRNEACRLYR